MLIGVGSEILSILSIPFLPGRLCSQLMMLVLMLRMRLNIILRKILVGIEMSFH